MNQEGREAWERVERAVHELVEAIVEAAYAVVGAFIRAVKPYISAMVEYWWWEIKKAPPHIVYLAFHAKKKRIRKKNLARLCAYD